MSPVKIDGLKERSNPIQASIIRSDYYEKRI